MIFEISSFRNNYCGRCQPEFWVGDTEVTSQCDSRKCMVKIIIGIIPK